MEKNYPELSKTIDHYLGLIDKSTEISQSQKNELAQKFHSLFSAYASRSASVLNPMVTGPARFPTRQNAKRISSERSAWEKVEEFLDKYPYIFKAEQGYFGQSLREENNKREAIFQSEDYKIVEYTLKTGEKRVGFHFAMRIKRQLQVALKSRGFRWNARINLWGGTIESYEKHKEWCESLSEKYKDYIR